MSHLRSNSGRSGRTEQPDRLRNDFLSGPLSGVPTAGPSWPPTGATAVSRDCIGFQHNWPCGHQQNLLGDGNGCLLADDAALINHVHWMFDLGDDGFPCPVCPQEELSPPPYYPPVAEQPGRTPMDDLQWRLDSMAHDPHFRQLKGEVDARTPVPEPVDPWRRPDLPEMEDLWQEIVTLGMRLMQMRREPRGPGSGPIDTTTYAGIIAAQGGFLAPQARAPAPSTMAPTEYQGHHAHTGATQRVFPGLGQPVHPVPVRPVPTGPTQPGQSGMGRRRSSLNAATAFRGEFIPGNVAWAPNRLSRRQAARARAAWSLAHHQPGQSFAQRSSAQPTAPAQSQHHPPQTRGVLTRVPPQLTRLSEVITAEDLDKAEVAGEASGKGRGATESRAEASAGAGVRARFEAFRPEEAFGTGGENVYRVSDGEK